MNTNTTIQEPVLKAQQAVKTSFVDTFGIGNMSLTDLLPDFDQQMLNQKFVDADTIKALTTNNIVIRFVDLTTLANTIAKEPNTKVKRYLLKEMSKAKLLPRYALAIVNRTTKNQRLVGITTKNIDRLNKNLVYQQTKQHHFTSKDWIRVLIFLQNLKHATADCQTFGAEKAADLFVTVNGISFANDEPYVEYYWNEDETSC